MSRLVLAILILLGVLLGLRIISSPGIRQWFLNQIGGAPPTQTTGFNTPIPGNISENTPISPSGPPPNGSPPTDGGNGTDGDGSDTPSKPLQPIPGGW